MPRFAYTGRAAGGPVSGELDGDDAGAIATLLQSRGVMPLRIARSDDAAAAAAPGAGGSWLSRPLQLGQAKVSTSELMMFTRQLHTLLRSGVPILRALAGLQDAATSAKMKQTLGSVRHSLQSGIELSMCMAQQAAVFDRFYISMVRVGEMTGKLDDIFMRLYKHLEFDQFMHQQVKSALRYPSFVIAAMMAALTVINVMVIPAFAGVFASFKAELPLATQVLLATSKFTLNYGWLLLGTAVAAGFGLRHWIGTVDGRYRFDRLSLRLPLVGRVVRKATLSRFARSFALALKAGVPVEQALSVVAQTVDNAYISRKVDAMRESVERGETILRSAVASGVFTPVVLQMIAVGEETGTVDELMDEIAELYSNDVQYELKTLSQQIEPILVVFMGVLVLVLAMGVFLPMWELGRVAIKK